MERHLPAPLPPHVASEQIRAADEAYRASVGRATPPAGLILAVSFFCGVLTTSPADRGPGHAATIVAVVWLVVELLRLSATNRWRALRSLPRAGWNALEAALIAAAIIVGSVVGPHLLASRSGSPPVSWGLGAAVTVTVAGCLFAARASYRRRSARVWRS